ncbi:MAG: exo-alpha-sialidase [Actinobacteria bacterium]|nr:exo-alpha-sialidase [Actinomycetota bacterium]
MRRAILASVVAVALLSVFTVGTPASGAKQLNKALTASLKAPKRLPNGAFAPQLSGGTLATAEEALGISAPSAAHAPAPAVHGPPFAGGTNGCPNTFAGPIPNVRANQMCDLRRQAEEWVAVNPTDLDNVVVSQNDSRMGFNQTGVDWSLDGGATFGDYAVPTQNFTCAGPTHDAFSDPIHAFDMNGNLFYGAIGFNIFDGVNGIYMWRSNAANKGSFLHSPTGTEFSSTPSTVVCESDPGSPIFHDKEFMAVDAFPASPFEGNIYFTWTRFDFSAGYVESPIYFTRSTDGGNTWANPKEISGANAAICSQATIFGAAGPDSRCNFDQGSWPVIGPDGSINVVYNNCNSTATSPFGPPGVCQQLFVKSTNGGVTWSAPVMVAKDFATQPVNLGGTDPVTGCPSFRQCLFPNGYRMNDFPAMGIDETSGKLGVFWADFRNGGPCATDTSFGVPFPVLPCDNMNNDVFYATSTDGGATWGPTKLITKMPGGGPDPAAQWQPWGDVGEDGKLYVAYYDRKYGGCEGTGCNDITLAASNPRGSRWTFTRITTGSMPDLDVAANPFQAGFLGDYIGLQVIGGKVHIVWADTRGLGGTVEEDIYYASVPA